MICRRGRVTLAALCMLIASGAWFSAAQRAYCGDSRNSSPTHDFKLQFGDQPLYFVIENEFRDSGGVPPLLSYSTSIKERRSIIQRRNAPNAQPLALPGSNLVSLVWDCDRYEAREQGMKEESTYDSLRNSFAPGSMHELESNADSKSTFLIDPKTGAISNLSLTPGVMSSLASRRGSMSKTVEKCSLTQNTMKSLLESIGFLYLPDGPKRVGDIWDRTTVEPQGTFGVMTTITHCKLTAVKKVDGRDVAVIDITSNITLKPNPPPPTQPVFTPNPHVKAATQPVKPPVGAAQRITPPPQPRATKYPPPRPPTPAPSPAPAPAAKPATTMPAITTSGPSSRSNPPKVPQQREFRLDKGILSGNVEFDLTHGELLRLTLRREIAFVADVESQGMGKMQLRSGTGQNLSIKSSHAPPPKPVIVGGKVPPKLSREEQDTLAEAQRTQAASTQPASTQPGVHHRTPKIQVNPAGRGAVSDTRQANDPKSSSGGGAVKRSKPGGPTSRPHP